MFPNVDASPVDLAHFPQCSAVLDIVYNPIETKLTKQAKDLNMAAETGLDMLVAQAVYAQEVYQNRTLCSSDEECIWKSIHKLRWNIIPLSVSYRGNV